jgi:hypothetical protein
VFLSRIAKPNKKEAYLIKSRTFLAVVNLRSFQCSCQFMLETIIIVEKQNQSAIPP